MGVSIVQILTRSMHAVKCLVLIQAVINTWFDDKSESTHKELYDTKMTKQKYKAEQGI